MWAHAGKETTMTRIDVFDTEARRIEKLVDKYDACDASIIEVLFDIIDENEIDIDDYM